MAGGDCCKLPFKATEGEGEMQEATVSLPDAEEISTGAPVAAAVVLKPSLCGQHAFVLLLTVWSSPQDGEAHLLSPFTPIGSLKLLQSGPAGS